MKYKTIIVDIDGTIANIEWRRSLFEKQPIDWDLVDKMSEHDLPNQWCVNLVTVYSNLGYHVLFVTGRSERYRANTQRWISRNVPGLSSHTVMMRPDNDFREDSVVKEHIYNSAIKHNFDVEFVVDDRASVVEMWRGLGLVCLQCAKGDY